MPRWRWHLLALLAFCLSAGRAADGQAAIRDAAAALERGDFLSAEKKLRAELQLHPDNAEALSLLGAALDNQKKLRDAGQAHRRAVAIAPRDAGVFNRYGDHLRSAGDESAAREAYRKTLAIEPAHFNANLQLARLALKKKSPEEALGYLNRLPSGQQDTPPAVALRLRALYLGGYGADAEALVARLQSGDATLNSSIGLALAEAGQFDKAETFLTRALSADPGNLRVLYNLGVVASFAGHSERARDVLETALRQQPQNVDVLYSLAYVYEALKRREDAVRLLARAAQLAPQRVDVQKLLAITTTELQAWADATAAWDRYLKLEPNDDFARRDRGFTAARGGRFEQGVAELKSFLERHPDDADGHYELGLAVREADPADALIHLDKAVALTCISHALLARGRPSWHN